MLTAITPPPPHPQNRPPQHADRQPQEPPHSNNENPQPPAQMQLSMQLSEKSKIFCHISLHPWKIH